MMTLLETMGAALWRASWQAAVLALLVALILRCLGERLAPRWRFLLWGIVLTRLLVVATPATPWSVFNLVPAHLEAGTQPRAQRASHDVIGPAVEPVGFASPDTASQTDSTRTADSSPVSEDPEVTIAAEAPAADRATRTGTEPSTGEMVYSFSLWLALAATWLAGCLCLGIKLVATSFVLRRRLSACRPVTDAAILSVLESAGRQLGLKRVPALLVIPDGHTPCIVGAWNPRIVLPESVVTESSTARLRHVLAHELAHLVRGDLWTNWLLLAARILHWCNPIAWWTVREMQTEREAACDELAFTVLGEGERSAYATTIVEVAAGFAPSKLVPGLIGFSSSARLKTRIERLLRTPSVRILRAPVSVGLLLGTSFLGLTDAMPAAEPRKTKESPETTEAPPEEETYTFSGRCVDNVDQKPLSGVTVRLYRITGRTSPPVEIARMETGDAGRFEFKGLVPPRNEVDRDHLDYAVFGFADKLPIGISFFHFQGDKKVVELEMAREFATLSGQVIDSAGKPVAGAAVMPYIAFDRPVPDFPSATTDAEGRFEIEGLGVFKWDAGRQVGTSFAVRHPDYPHFQGQAKILPADVVVKLPSGCVVTGTVTDKVTGRPAADALITARRFDEWGQSFAATDKEGRYRLVVPEGRYDFLADAKDRVCVAEVGRACLTGEQIELPEFSLISGGFISGRVINTATKEVVTVSERGGQIMLGLVGPSQPEGRAISPQRMAAVDKQGRFTLRAAPGENFPYFVNIRGDRMAWDTQKMPAIVVKEGETTSYDMLITPEVSPEERLKAARKLVESLPKSPTERTEKILVEFRKLNHTVDETELWCLLMRELVAIGPDAVPPLCAALDQASENLMLRRLAFALRAIGDPRAVPALIRALPRTLLPASSDFGLIVGDHELAKFMQTHDLDEGAGGTHFGLGRPVREIVGALHKLTGENFDDADLFSMHLSEDSRRQILQRRIYLRQAQRWGAWWDAHSQEFTDNVAYQKSQLLLQEAALPPATQILGKTARISGETSGAVLSPAVEMNGYAWHFYDLDTGFRPRWPEQIPRNEAALKTKEFADWASQNGIDLLCITHRQPDGTEVYVLRALGMKVREISSRDVRNLDQLVASGKLPEGRPVEELLMHYDTQSQRLVPNANAAFLFTTREGSLGMIEVTDRVTRTSDLTGQPAGAGASGVGFHLGVKFNLKAIIP